jgi:hypothetical protein
VQTTSAVLLEARLVEFHILCKLELPMRPPDLQLHAQLDPQLRQDDHTPLTRYNFKVGGSFEADAPHNPRGKM